MSTVDVTKIQRLHPYTCECIIEQEQDYDVEGTPIGETRFLMMNYVCEKHQPLATKTKKADHSQKAKRPLDLIAQTKKRNSDDADNSHKRAKTNKDKSDALLNKTKVSQHNDSLDEEWQELANQAHAFDSHIFDQIKAEIAAANNG